MNRRTPILASLFVLATVLPGCGGDKAQGGPTPKGVETNCGDNKDTGVDGFVDCKAGRARRMKYRVALPVLLPEKKADEPALFLIHANGSDVAHARHHARYFGRTAAPAGFPSQLPQTPRMARAKSHGQIPTLSNNQRGPRAT